MVVLRPLVFLACLCVCLSDGRGGDARDYPCSVCEWLATHEDTCPNPNPNPNPSIPHGACEMIDHVALKEAMVNPNPNPNPNLSAALGVCVQLGYCESNDTYLSYLDTDTHTYTPASPIQLRVSRAHGARGKYTDVRVSIIARGEVKEYEDLFQYKSRFRYRWTSNYLYSSLVELKEGHNTLRIPNIHTHTHTHTPIHITLPAVGTGVRGVMIADPCVANRWGECAYKDSYQTFTRTAALLNVFMADPSTSFYMIHGDNFYGKTGEITQAFYNQLTLETMSKFLGVTAGNHDYWVWGTPEWALKDDQYGNGFMQWYTMDTAAAISNPLFDFSVDPDAYTNRSERLAAKDNFCWYNMIGNMGVVGYSGVYTLDDVTDQFQEACQFFTDANASIVLLAGHWNMLGDGARPSMTVPSVYETLKDMYACAGIADRIRYVMGHTHCNRVRPDDTNGFLVAGQGAGGCGNYGVPVFDTTGGRFRVWYFGINDVTGLDQFDKVASCVSVYGIDGCTDYATLWVDEPL